MADGGSRISFKSVFIAVFLGTALVVAAMLVNSRRPAVERQQPSAQLVEATGKCAECHRHETSAIVQQYEMSRHAKHGVNCLDCHRAVPGQKSRQHKGFTIAVSLTAKNCAQCHAEEYRQYERSRHAAPAWAAVNGAADFSKAQLAEGERYNKGWVDRKPNALAMLEGDAAMRRGCDSCHSIGKPNPDGSFGTCTDCHARHDVSVATARLPTTCGQCHMGPDHSQIEIYDESKHGVLFNAERASMNLAAFPNRLTTRDMPVPTCATCHMSGLEGMGVTHDMGERLSWYLFEAVSKKRPNYLQGQTEMKEVCEKCHASSGVDRFYKNAEQVVQDTNAKVANTLAIVDGLRKDGLLTRKPFDEPIEFMAFDLWHYFGRTTKHGAFMGGADFVQWHGNYELLRHKVQIEAAAREIRARAAVASKPGQHATP